MNHYWEEEDTEVAAAKEDTIILMLPKSEFHAYRQAREGGRPEP